MDIMQEEVNKKSSEAYQLTHSIDLKPMGMIFAIAINRESTIVAAAGQNFIQIYDLNEDLMTIKQEIKVKDSSFQSLNFVGKSKQFVTGDLQGNVIFWDWNQQINQYEESSRIQEKGAIQLLIASKLEDLIVHYIADKIIRFRQKQDEWKLIQSLMELDVCSSICFNESETQLLSIHPVEVVIHEKCSDLVWRKFQVILFDGPLSGCFINNNAVIYSIFGTTKANILNQSSSFFEYHNEIRFQQTEEIDFLVNYLQLNFNSQKQILLAANSNHVQIIQIQNNLECKSLQSLNLNGCYFLKVAMSESGKFLLIFDGQKLELQVRKFQQ